MKKYQIVLMIISLVASIIALFTFEPEAGIVTILFIASFNVVLWLVDPHVSRKKLKKWSDE